MAVFSASGSVTVSPDGKTQTFHDDSNYSSNSDGILLTNILGRVLTVYNSDGSVFTTGSFNPTSLTYDVAVTFDKAFIYQLVVTIANSTTKTGTVTYLSTAFYNNTQRDLANKLNCTCTKNGLCSSMSKARELYYSAISSNLFGDNVSAQAEISAANTYLNQKTNCSC